MENVNDTTNHICYNCRILFNCQIAFSMFPTTSNYMMAKFVYVMYVAEYFLSNEVWSD
jgi:hypothetical protein